MSSIRSRNLINVIDFHIKPRGMWCIAIHQRFFLFECKNQSGSSKKSLWFILITPDGLQWTCVVFSSAKWRSNDSCYMIIHVYAIMWQNLDAPMKILQPRLKDTDSTPPI